MQILILLGSRSDLPVTEQGLAVLKELEIGYGLRIASAHRTPQFVHQLVAEFDRQGGQICICVAGKSAHLAGVVAALTVKPILAVPVYGKETAGFDALLSMCQMPKGVPVATMGFGNSGFLNACLQAAQILALQQSPLQAKLVEYRKAQERQVLTDDQAASEIWEGLSK